MNVMGRDEMQGMAEPRTVRYVAERVGFDPALFERCFRLLG
jgi:hypothetical protein